MNGTLIVVAADVSCALVIASWGAYEPSGPPAFGSLAVPST